MRSEFGIVLCPCYCTPPRLNIALVIGALVMATGFGGCAQIPAPALAPASATTTAPMTAMSSDELATCIDAALERELWTGARDLCAQGRVGFTMVTDTAVEVIACPYDCMHHVCMPRHGVVECSASCWTYTVVRSDDQCRVIGQGAEIRNVSAVNCANAP